MHKITYGGGAWGDTSSTAPGGTSLSVPATAASVPIASPATDEPHRQGWARGRLVTSFARQKKKHDVHAFRNLQDEQMENEQISAEQIPDEDMSGKDVQWGSGTHASAS